MFIMKLKWKTYLLVGLALAGLLSGCTKQIALDLGDTKPLYVIDGRVSTLEGPYYVRITKSSTGYGIGNTGSDNAEAVLGAQVIITDDMGTVDTLTPSVADTTTILYAYDYDTAAKKMITHRTTFDPKFNTAARGYYRTKKTVGRPGHTYQLSVRIGDELFQASAYMPPVTKLDSIDLVPGFADIDGMPKYIPRAFFKEPQNEENYYLLQFNRLTWYPYEDPYYKDLILYLVMDFYVVDDKLLPPYVNGLGVRKITSSTSPYAGTESYPYPYSNREPMQVRLSSLTKQAYQYYRLLGKQLEGDGGVYKPLPATAPGNISGGALGLFYATDVSYQLYLP